MKGRAFKLETMQWVDAVLKEVQAGGEFLDSANRLWKVRSRGGMELCPEIDAAELHNAERPYDPNNWRTPTSDDVVFVLGKEYPDTGHWLMRMVRPSQRFLFQGRMYTLEPSDIPGAMTLMGSNIVLRFRSGMAGFSRCPFPDGTSSDNCEPVKEEQTVNFRNIVVRETRVTCAAMPEQQGLGGTLTPPTAEEFRASFEDIQQGDPALPTEVLIHYTHPEPFGYAEVELVVPADEAFRLANGESVSALDVKVGMEICLTDGALGKITRSKTYFDIPRPPEQLDNGLWESRVTARVKHTALEVLQWRLGGKLIEGTPGHLVWSVTRQAWVRAFELQPGEFVRPEGGAAVSVDSVGPLKTGLVEVYGIEIEFFHNYFVTAGEAAMLAHNGLDCVNKPKSERQKEGGVYLLRDPITGEVVRTGRTGNLAQRQSQHLRDSELKAYTFEVVHKTNVYAEQRGLEQVLHDTYKPSLNYINPISSTNPNRSNYLDAANGFLGRQGAG